MAGFRPPADRRTRREWCRRQIERHKQPTLSVIRFCLSGARCVGFNRPRPHASKPHEGGESRDPIEPEWGAEPTP